MLTIGVAGRRHAMQGQYYRRGPGRDQIAIANLASERSYGMTKKRFDSQITGVFLRKKVNSPMSSLEVANMEMVAHYRRHGNPIGGGPFWERQHLSWRCRAMAARHDAFEILNINYFRRRSSSDTPMTPPWPEGGAQSSSAIASLAADHTLTIEHLS